MFDHTIRLLRSLGKTRFSLNEIISPDLDSLKAATLWRDICFLHHEKKLSLVGIQHEGYSTGPYQVVLHDTLFEGELSSEIDITDMTGSYEYLRSLGMGVIPLKEIISPMVETLEEATLLRDICYLHQNRMIDLKNVSGEWQIVMLELPIKSGLGKRDSKGFGTFRNVSDHDPETFREEFESCIEEMNANLEELNAGIRELKGEIDLMNARLAPPIDVDKLMKEFVFFAEIPPVYVVDWEDFERKERERREKKEKRKQGEKN